MPPLWRHGRGTHWRRAHDDALTLVKKINCFQETPLSPSPSNGVLVGDEDCDSGILVSEATSTPLSSLPGSGGGAGAGGRGGRGSLPWGGAMGALGAATAASRALRSASLDRELLGGSPLLDHDEGEDPEELSHAVTSQGM